MANTICYQCSNCGKAEQTRAEAEAALEKEGATMNKCDKCDVKGTCGLPKKINEAAADYGLTVEITACEFEKQWGCAGSDIKGE